MRHHPKSMEDEAVRITREATASAEVDALKASLERVMSQHGEQFRRAERAESALAEAIGWIQHLKLVRDDDGSEADRALAAIEALKGGAT